MRQIFGIVFVENLCEHMSHGLVRLIRWRIDGVDGRDEIEAGHAFVRDDVVEKAEKLKDAGQIGMMEDQVNAVRQTIDGLTEEKQLRLQFVTVVIAVQFEIVVWNVNQSNEKLFDEIERIEIVGVVRF